MILPLEFHVAVRDEIRDAYIWYEQRRIDLGREFMDELERVLGGIAANPVRYGLSEADIREGFFGASPMRSTIATCRIGFAFWLFSTRRATPRGGKQGVEPTRPNKALQQNRDDISRS